METKETKKSTYTEAHKRYYEKYKPLIQARRKKYQKAYKQLWWKKNRERILQERALKRLAEKNKITP